MQLYTNDYVYMYVKLLEKRLWTLYYILRHMHATLRNDAPVITEEILN